jgi:hypothetical protein
MGTVTLASEVLLLHNPMFLQVMRFSCCLLHADFLLGLLFNPDNEGDTFL